MRRDCAGNGVGNLRSSLTRALVSDNVVGAAEDLECRVAFNTIGLAQLGLLCAVNFGQLNVLLFESSGSLLVFGGQGFAVTAVRR